MSIAWRTEVFTTGEGTVMQRPRPFSSYLTHGAAGLCVELLGL
jgi:hypothetical protein